MITLDQVKIIREGRKKKVNNPDQGDFLNESDDKKNKNKKKGRSAERQRDATGGKTTGSLKKGNLSFPGDRSGAYNVTKADIAARQGLKDAGASGDFSPTMPTDKRKKGQAKRDARIKELDTPDPFKIDTSTAAADNAKQFGTPKPPKVEKASTTVANTTVGKSPYAQGDPLMGKGDYNDLPSKPPTQRFDNREPFQDDDLGQRTGKTGDKLKNKQPIRLQPAKTTKGIPQKARVQRQKPVSGTYRSSGVGQKERGLASSSSDATDFANKVKKNKNKSTNPYPSYEFKDKTGRVYNMADKDEKAEFLKQQGKKYKSKKETRGTSSSSSNKSSSGGGTTPPGGGKPPSGGSGIPPTDPPKTPKSTFKFNTKDFKTRYQRYKSSYYKPGRIAKRVAKLAMKKPGLATLALAGTAIGADYLRRKFFTKELDRNKDFKSVELKSKSGKSLTDPSYIKSLKAIKDPNEREKQLKINRNLTDITKTKLSNDAFKQMAPGGRLTGGSGSSVYKFVTQNPRYKSKVEKTVKDRGFRVDKKTGYYSGDPYGILSKKS